jgi:hypothetical protein
MEEGAVDGAGEAEAGCAGAVDAPLEYWSAVEGQEGQHLQGQCLLHQRRPWICLGHRGLVSTIRRPWWVSSERLSRKATSS